jgi:hypothetical protein
MTLHAHEFIRRFLLHMIPKGSVQRASLWLWPTGPKAFSQSAVNF